LHLLDTCTTWTMPPALFPLVIFFNSVMHLCLASLDCNPPIYTSWVAGMSSWHNHAQLLLVEMGFCELFAPTDLKPQSSWSLPPKYLGLQVWATVLCLVFSFLILNNRH
jgi:hypothetical protein